MDLGQCIMLYFAQNNVLFAARRHGWISNLILVLLYVSQLPLCQQRSRRSCFLHSSRNPTSLRCFPVYKHGYETSEKRNRLGCKLMLLVLQLLVNHHNLWNAMKKSIPTWYVGRKYLSRLRFHAMWGWRSRHPYDLVATGKWKRIDFEEYLNAEKHL